MPWAGALFCLLSVRNLLGHHHSLPQAAPTNTSPLSFPILAQELLFPQVFQVTPVIFILLVEVEMLPASWKLLETGRPFMEMLTQLYL